MSSDNFWNCIAAIAASLEHEASIERAEFELRQMSRERCTDERLRLKLIVCQLARIEMRLTVE